VTRKGGGEKKGPPVAGKESATPLKRSVISGTEKSRRYQKSDPYIG